MSKHRTEHNYNYDRNLHEDLSSQNLVRSDHFRDSQFKPYHEGKSKDVRFNFGNSSKHKNESVPNILRGTTFSNESFTQQSPQSKEDNLGMFKLKVQEEIKKNLANQQNKSPETNRKTDNFLNHDYTFNKANSEMKCKSEVTPNKHSADKSWNDNSSDDGSENISDDPSHQEYVLADQHQIKQINFQHFYSPNRKISTPVKLNTPIESSSKKEVVEFDVEIPGDSEPKFASPNRESNIADGFQNSNDSIIKNLQYGTIVEEEEEDRQSTMKFDPKSNLITNNVYVQPKRLEDTHMLKNYSDTYEDNMNEDEYEWKDTQQNIFPPNFTETAEIEEIIQVEEEEESEYSEPQRNERQSETRKENERDRVQREITYQTPEYQNMLEELEEDEHEKNKGNEDTIIHLTPVENPLYRNSETNRSNNLFDKVVVLSSSKDGFKGYDEMLSNENDSEFHPIHHDTLENPNDIFTLNRDSSPEQDTPEIKYKYSTPFKVEKPQLPKINARTMEETLTAHKQNRIEQLVDWMYILTGKDPLKNFNTVSLLSGRKNITEVKQILDEIQCYMHEILTLYESPPIPPISLTSLVKACEVTNFIKMKNQP